MGDGTKVMLISAKVGAGHIRAAEALEEAWRQSRPEVEVRNIEALGFANAVYRRSFTAGYNQLAAKMPSVWGFIYETMEEKPARSKTKAVTTFVDRLNLQPLVAAVRKFAPSAVVCTHYLPAGLLGQRRIKGRLGAKLSVVLTDYDIHTMWIQRGVDHYYVATDEMAYALTAKGVESERVSVTGIPIMPVFGERHPPKARMRERLGLDPGKRTVLVLAGGFGLADSEATVRHLAEAGGEAQFLAVAGKNASLQSALERVAARHKGRVVPYGFVTNIEEMMAASDFAVTKSGGLTSSECLAMGLPMVIWSPIPGQEERNSDYLLENGAALRANSPAHLVYKVQALLGDEKRLARMQSAARRLARPRAAFEIAEQVTRGL